MFFSSLNSSFSYGAKGQVEASYQGYAEHYFQRFAANVTSSLLKILADHMKGIYVSERVLFLSLSHMAEAVSHSELWKDVKPHFQVRLAHADWELQLGA